MVTSRGAGLFRSGVVAACLLTASTLAQGQPQPESQPSVRIDLPGALARARENSQQLQSATLALDLAREDRAQARAALLPSLSYYNQYIYTQGNGTESGVFVANDGVHVYSSQAQVHQEVYSPVRLAEYRQLVAGQALASARRDVVERGLVSTVVRNFYAAVAARRKVANSQLAFEEAARFVNLTEKLETGGEVAHSDVLKAELVLRRSERDLQEARLAAEKAHIELAVLIFPDFRMDFELVDDLADVTPLPAYSGVEETAMTKSPELHAARESLRQEEHAFSVARAGYLPSLSFDYFFGINANQFAVRDPDGFNRLGSSVQATLNVPVWDWSATRSKVRQADIRRRQAQLDLTLTQKQLTSTLRTTYLEAEASQSQLDSLRLTLDAATESLRLTNLRYQAGEVTVLEVVDAQSTLLEARNAYDEGLARYRVAVTTIQTLTGTI